MKRAGILSALLATAALMCALPGMLRMPASTDRTAQRLRPAQLRTLTVWLMPGDIGDRKLISEMCAAFEKANDGVRVFLRVVTAEEFTAKNAVLPDVALFETGDISVPDELFVPLAQSLGSAGCFAGTPLAAPLWLSPNVLGIPAQWTADEHRTLPERNSLLASATAPPENDDTGILTAEEIPWGMLLEAGGLRKPSGVALQQLLYVCPAELRPRLTAARANGQTAAQGQAADHSSASRPRSLGASPTPVPSITAPAKVQTLAQYRADVNRGENVTVYPLSPAVSTRVRFIALCSDSKDAQSFLRFAVENRPSAAKHDLLPCGAQSPQGDPLLMALQTIYGADPPLPNAFAHTHEELDGLCADAFDRCEDPVQTLLKLR